MANLKGGIAQVGPIIERAIPLLSDLAIQPLALPSAYQSPLAPPASMVTRGLEPEHSNSASRGCLLAAWSRGEAQRRRWEFRGWEFEEGKIMGIMWH